MHTEDPNQGLPSDGVETVAVEDGVIRLGQLLKLAGLVESGTHARRLLADGEVQVNAVIERRRGRQLAAGDLVVVSLPAGERTLRVG